MPLAFTQEDFLVLNILLPFEACGFSVIGSNEMVLFLRSVERYPFEASCPFTSIFNKFGLFFGIPSDIVYS